MGNPATIREGIPEQTPVRLIGIMFSGITKRMFGNLLEGISYRFFLEKKTGKIIEELLWGIFGYDLVVSEEDSADSFGRIFEEVSAEYT